jgi:spore germination protein YaaH
MVERGESVDARKVVGARRLAGVVVRALPVIVLAAALSASVSTGASAATVHRGPTRVLGFYTDWDPASYTTLTAHYRDITVLSPGWLLFAADGTLGHDDTSAEAQVNAFIADKHPTFKLEPLVADWDVASDNWDPDALAATLADPAKRDSLAASITAEAQAGGWQGVNIDFESLPGTSRDDLTAFMQVLYGKMHPLGLEVSQDIGVEDDVYDQAALASANDFLVPMFYDQHWGDGNYPGPVAAQPWFLADLKSLLRNVPAGKVVVGMGNYGYNYKRGPGNAPNIYFPDAIALAKKTKKTIKLDSASLNPTFAYGSHRVWFLDAVTAFNEISAASKYGVSGYAVWKLGGEDPALWRVLHRRDSLSGPVARSLRTSKRSITFNSKRKLITSERIRP